MEYPSVVPLQLNMEMDWLIGCFMVSERVRSEKVPKISTAPDPALSQNDGSNTSSGQCIPASVYLQSVF